MRSQTPDGLPSPSLSPPHGLLAGARVLVASAASGIGLAVAVRCLADGAEVAAVDRNGPGLERAIAGLSG